MSAAAVPVQLRARDVVVGLVVGGIVLLLGSAAIRAESALRALDMRANVERELASSALRLERELQSVHAELAGSAYRVDVDFDAELLARDRYTVWRSDGRKIEILAGPRLQLDYLAEPLARESGSLIGPLPSPDGRDVLSLRTELVRADRHGWLGASIDLGELWAQSGLLDFVRTGMNVRVTTSDEFRQPLYWSSPHEPDFPVSARIELPAGTGWELSAAPTAGWRDRTTDWATAVFASVVGLVYGLTFMFLSREPRVMQGANVELQKRLESKDADFSALLRNREQLESDLRASQSLDTATGLSNRASFIEHLDGKLAERRRVAGAGVVVAAVQFRQFESVSHSFGVPAAGKLLSQAADRLQVIAGGQRQLARVSDKELAISLPLTEQNRPAALAQRVLEALQEPVLIDGRGVYANAVVGIAESADGYTLGSDLLDHAALAADDAVASPERWFVFREDAHAQRVSLLRLEADLQNAVKKNEFRLHFQPIVKIATGSVVGLEALLRWQHPREALIPPDRFIPLAEGMGQMRQISEWVMQQGVAHTKQWLGLREDPIYVSVNLSPRDLSAEFCGQLFSLLDEMHVPPEALCVEVTETAVVRDFRVAARLINELNERGVHVLLDDFGTGYSSLSYLRELPFHAVKIDKSFVQRMSSDTRDFGLVRSIVSLVHYLGMECVAEGIETQEQLDLIAMVDCDYGQGFFFSKPVVSSDVESLLASGSAPSKRIVGGR